MRLLHANAAGWPRSGYSTSALGKLPSRGSSHSSRLYIAGKARAKAWRPAREYRPLTDNGHMGRFDGEFLIGEQHAGQRTRHLGRCAGQIAHRMRCQFAIGFVAEIAIEKIHEAGDLDLVIHQLGRLGEHAGCGLRRLRGQKSSGRVLECRADVIPGLGSGRQPIPVAGGGIKIEKRLSHRQRIAEIRAAAIVVAVAESTVRQRAVVVHPFRGFLRNRQHLRIVGDVVKRDQSADRPAVLARINMLVDARHSEFAAVLVAHA